MGVSDLHVHPELPACEGGGGSRRSGPLWRDGGALLMGDMLSPRAHGSCLTVTSSLSGKQRETFYCVSAQMQRPRWQQ